MSVVQPCYVIVTGGVLSGLGKGVVTASLGALFRMMGLRCTLKKLDPYLNVDPGTMNPVEHGEVFVTEDGAETDLDIGYYERFAGITATNANSTSSGKIYQRLLDRERQGDFLGKTVQMIPHFTDELQSFIQKDAEHYDVVLCEIGGSVGDIEAMPFYEALRQLRLSVGPSRFVLVHLTYIVHYCASNEFKTKPAQNAIRELMQTGLTPDILVCRSEHPEISALPLHVRTKLQQFCGRVVEAPNVDNIYEIPMRFVDQGVDTYFQEHLQCTTHMTINTSLWKTLNTRMQQSVSTKSIVIAIVGKYVQLHDAYCSLLEAIFHASIHPSVQCRIEYKWIDARTLETQLYQKSDSEQYSLVKSALESAQAVIVPGGFGSTGLEAMIQCLRVARTEGIPTFGICLGMQLMVVEWIRHVTGNMNVISEEWEVDDEQSKQTSITVVGRLPNLDNSAMGGTMRLGSHQVTLRKGSDAYRIYQHKIHIKERHRHRYEVKPEWVPVLEKSGLRVSGHREGLVEIVEQVDHHPWYVGCQFHPEYISTPFNPHPLVVDWLHKTCTHGIK